ncbi:hypothetical protein PF005_g3822 [Phytophthora fragariae]|uniref:Phospholipid-transporting ATPase n=2 Tax=Phytophthora fragariae TaxID=53985 RepID=A0A6A3Z777_9STRA|nr:hypothetical protein PF005_g3822 [Phytophthora fragariae]
MPIQAEAVSGPRAGSAGPDDPAQRLRVIRVDRKSLLTRANAAQRRRRRQEREARRLGNRRSSWLFGGANRPHEDAVEPPSPFACNVVVSAKYSAWNFVPRVLLAQLQRPSNVYFLFIAVLQTIREVSNTSGIPTILLPLAVVFVCSAIKEALEDRERHRADGVANSRPVLTLTPLGDWEQRQWGDLRVGDIVKVMNDQTIPADLFLLSTEAVQHEEDVRRTQVQVVTANPREVQGPDDLEEGKRDDSELLLLDVRDNQGTQEKQQTTESNLAYIETKSLDGETNLKIRTAIPLVASLCRGSGGTNRSVGGGGHKDLRGMMVCEQPNNRITSFEGTFSAMLSPDQAQSLGVAVSDSNSSVVQPAASLLQTEIGGDGLVRVRMPVTAKQMILRSCVLRNTRSVTGMVVFTGHETKVFCSNTEPVVKTSSVERRLNRLIIGIVFIQQLVCFLGALLGAHWMHTEGDSLWYLLSASERRHHILTGAPISHPLTELAKLHLRYFIIMQNFVPISLNVSLEFVKYWQAYFIEQDLEMYDKLSDTPAMVRSSALNEDLGRVHHVFTDKTGTLTMNLMLFRYCMVGGKHYGGIMQDKDIEAEVPSAASSPSSMTSKDGPRFVDFDPTELFADLQAGGEQAETLRRFLRHLALCHTLIPTKSLAEMCSTSFPEYSASSPDEQALVSAAAFCNVRFVHRTPAAMMLMEPGWAAPSTYKLLNVLEFDSDRKRMTVIVETPDGTIELLCKGADNVIFERLATDQAAMPGGMSYDQAADQLTVYAKTGMRTLCLAYKMISRSEYEDWNARYSQAHASMEELVKRRQGRENAIDPLMNEIERDLILLGVTAVQDKLQAGVPATLRLLQETNIKVWTLTGDKMETAVNIGYASALLSHDMDVQQIGGDDYTSTAAALKELSQRSDQEDNATHLSPFMASLTTSSSRSKEGRRVRRHPRDARRRQQVRTNSFLSWANAAISEFFFGAPTKHKRKQNRKRHRSRRTSRTSAFSQTPMYSSVATDAEYADKFTSDEESLYDVGADANVEATHAPEYGSLAGSLYGGDNRHQNGPTSQQLALVIDGQALEYVLRPQLRKLFYQVTRQCASAVICCRVSPKQKAEIVEFVREFEPDSVTLAIGDGANDVAMIQSAHIGVGISGQEGAQAVNASDYALAQFRFLQRLLFVHGRWAYRRVAKLMSYMLYKNVTYVLTTFWFGCFSGFSGQPLILDVAAQSFNVLYTSVPLVLFAVFDQDVSSTSAAKFPYLYALGQKNVLLRRRVFWPWILNGVWHSLVIFFVSAWAFEGFGMSIRDFPVIATESGKGGGLITLGFVVFTNLVIVVNLKLCLETFMLTWQFLLTVTVSVLLWFAVGSLISLPNAGFPQATGEMEYLLELPTFWLVCFLVLSLSLLRDALWKIVRRFSLPSMYHILQERELMGLPNSPRGMLREHRRSVSNTAWSDEPATVVDYANLFSNMPRLESPEETLMRSSPLGEKLIASPFSTSSSGGDTIHPDHTVGFQSREKKRNIRIRGSFHAIGSSDSFGSGVEPSFLEAPGSVAATATASASVGARSSSFVGVPGAQYHGYAFSEDENVDSDVEAASSSTSRGDVDQGRATAFGPSSIKKVLKSVRGRKNA